MALAAQRAEELGLERLVRVLAGSELHRLALVARQAPLARELGVGELQDDRQAAGDGELRRAVRLERHAADEPALHVHLAERVRRDVGAALVERIDLDRRGHVLVDEDARELGIDQATRRRVLEDERRQHAHVEHRDLGLRLALVDDDVPVRLVERRLEHRANEPRVDADGVDVRDASLAEQLGLDPGRRAHHVHVVVTAERCGVGRLTEADEDESSRQGSR